MRLLLASTSPYRRALLKRLDIAFDVAAPNYDEGAQEHRFEAMDDGAFALELAQGKAQSMVGTHPAQLVLAADQIATTSSPRTLLHKPGTRDKAVAQLMSLRARTHALTTGVVLLDPTTGRCERELDRQRITMRAYAQAEVEAYVDAFAPLDCVGAYRIEDAGIRLFESVEGEDATGVMGLPLLAVCRLLRRFDVIP